MIDDTGTNRHYRNRAPQLGETYDTVDITHLHHLSTLLRPGDSVLDVGCGTGRDLAWLIDRGYRVTGVDPSSEMIAEARRRYAIPDGIVRTDTLPALRTITGQFSAITCMHVLHHLEDTALLDALYRLRSLLVPGGFLVIKIPSRHAAVTDGRHADGRRYILRDPGEYRFFLERLGLRRTAQFDEHHEATNAQWHTQVYAAPLEAGLNPIETIESVVWDDRKVNTYKFALLRAVADLAMHRTRAGRWTTDGRVAIPLNRIAERWIEYYWPLVTAGAGTGTGNEILLGQRITGKQDMTFRGSLTALAHQWEPAGGYAAFRAAVDRDRLSRHQQELLRTVLRDIGRGIRQPVQYAGNARTGKKLFEIVGTDILVSGSLWTELALMGRWIEDSILLRWAEFVATLKHQRPDVTQEMVLALLLKPRREDHDTSIAREIYKSSLTGIGSLECVWSGTTIRTMPRMEIDHAIPWALWYSNDLWNLLPADNKVNNTKRDKLPSRPLVEASRKRIIGDWEILWAAEPAMFGVHAARLVGQPIHDSATLSNRISSTCSRTPSSSPPPIGARSGGNHRDAADTSDAVNKTHDETSVRYSVHVHRRAERARPSAPRVHRPDDTDCRSPWKCSRARPQRPAEAAPPAPIP
jgi:SAM-dependent methyltransferase